MTRLLLIAAILLVGCQTEHTRLFDELNQIAKFDGVYEPTLFQSGKEDGFLEPLMQYDVYKIDSMSFEKLENSIVTNDRFKKSRYYLNIDLDNFLLKNHLNILNMPKSSISENHYEKTYYFYLLSDRKTFVVCKLNH